MKIVSYGIIYGEPELGERDISIDIRHKFPNPHGNRHLRKLTGIHPEVIWEVTGGRVHHRKLKFIRTIMELVDLIGKQPRDTVYIGCTGGKHRSVVVANILARFFGVASKHRDLWRY